MFTSIDIKFIFDSVRLGVSSSANILQIAAVAVRVVFLLCKVQIHLYTGETNRSVQPRIYIYVGQDQEIRANKGIYTLTSVKTSLLRVNRSN